MTRTLALAASLALIAACSSAAPSVAPTAAPTATPTLAPTIAATTNADTANATHIVKALDDLAIVKDSEMGVLTWASAEGRWTIENIGAGEGVFGTYSLAMLDLLSAVETDDWDAEVAALLRLRPTFERLSTG